MVSGSVGKNRKTCLDEGVSLPFAGRPMPKS